MDIIMDLLIVAMVVIMADSLIDGKNDIERLIDTVDTLKNTINAQNDIMYTMSERIVELEKAQNRDGFD